VGSPFGALRVARNGVAGAGALFRFPLAPGRREWGLAADLARCLPAPTPEGAAAPDLVKTAVGEFRLTEFQHYVLDWAVGPASEHPRILLDRKTLEQIGGKRRRSVLRDLARKLDADPAVIAWRTKDAALANRLAAETVKDSRHPMSARSMAGLELAPQFSPVGIRMCFRRRCAPTSCSALPPGP